MFKIGDFSKLSRVSVKTLHYYDEIGLLKPSTVDKFTSYRYYSADQLPRLNRILALKDLGFPLEQIGQILDEEPTAEQLRGMLRLRQAELHQQISEVEGRLAKVEERLKQIEQEGKMPEYEVILKRVEPLKIALAREVVPTQELMRERCGALCDEVAALLKERNIREAGPWLAVYHDNTADGIDVEMAVVVDTIEGERRGRAAEGALPAVAQMASVVYHGSYDDFAAVGQAHSTLSTWIESNGYQICGPSRELYIQTPNWESKPPVGVMEIQFPVEKR